MNVEGEMFAPFSTFIIFLLPIVSLFGSIKGQQPVSVIIIYNITALFQYLGEHWSKTVSVYCSYRGSYKLLDYVIVSQ